MVADEVRKLAEKTMAATEEVGDAVQNIQTQAQRNIEAVDAAAEGIVESSDAARESGRFMEEIVGIVEDTSSQVESIAAASEEQSAASEEINRAVEEVNRIATDAAEDMGQAALALENLSGLADELDAVIREMSGEEPSLRRKPVAALPAARPAPAKKPAPARKALPARAVAKPARPSALAKPAAARPARLASGAGGDMIQWNDDLVLGIGEVDAQHKILVEMINELHRTMKSGHGSTALPGLVSNLAAYAVRHFSDEEKLMEKHNYAGLLNHRGQHVKFVQTVEEFDKKLHEGKAAVTNEVMQFLKDWLVKHIQGTDRKYAPFLKERGVH